MFAGAGVGAAPPPGESSGPRGTATLVVTSTIKSSKCKMDNRNSDFLRGAGSGPVDLIIRLSPACGFQIGEWR